MTPSKVLIIGLLIGLAVLLSAGLAHCQSPPPPPTVKLTWNPDPNTGDTAIKVYRAATSGAEQLLSTITWTTTEPTTWTDLAPLMGSNYYELTFVGSGGKESKASNEAFAQVPVPPSNLQ